MTTKIITPMRGALTPEAEVAYKEGCGRTLTTLELRLLPFLTDRLLNNAAIGPRQVNREEIDVIDELIRDGHLIEKSNRDAGAFLLAITPAYWRTINEVLLHTYVSRPDTSESHERDPR